MSAVVVVSPTTEEPVTLNEIKLWLRLDEHEVSEDALLEGLITRARQRFEEATQRSVMVNTFDYWMDCAPTGACPLALPKAPLVSVTSITAFQSSEANDAGGTAMSTDEYYVDTAHEFGRVMPLSAYTYPTATRSINGFRVRFTAGYSTSSTGVPEAVKTEIKQLVARLYEHRGDELGQAKALADYGTVPSELDLPSWG